MKRLTKAQRSAKAKQRARKTRLAKAIKNLFKQANPAGCKRMGGARLRRNKGGSITIIPVKLPRKK